MCNERPAKPVQQTAAPTSAASTSAAHPHHMRDLARMVGAAIAVGVCASVIAVTGTLVLANNNPAAASTTEEWVEHEGLMMLKRDVEAMPVYTPFVAAVSDVSDDFDMATLAPNPGSLYFGDGCGAEEMLASERDWYVTIEHGVARVKVMQTFNPGMLEENDITSAEPGLGTIPFWFHANLPVGAKLVSARLDTTTASIAGTFRMQGAGADPDFADETGEGFSVYLQGQHVGGIDHASFTTGLLRPVQSGESLVFIYEYEMPAIGAFKLNLETQRSEHAATPGMNVSGPPSGMVWVEWRDAMPTTLSAMPKGSTVERRRGSIVGLSWNAPALSQGDQFTLAWK